MGVGGKAACNKKLNPIVCMCMNDNVSDIERRVLAVIQKGMPASESPYEEMAERIGIGTEELLRILKEWQKNGKIRRVGAVINHTKIGLKSNAMVVWLVEQERIDRVGEILAGFEDATHVYEREVCDGWPYNLYTMIHGRTEAEIKKIVERMSLACGIEDYLILETVKELKKVAPTYIVDEING